MSSDALLLTRVVEREVRVYRRVWRGSVFSSFLGPVLFLTAIGLGLGDLVDQGTGTIDGSSYLAFVTPGLLAASAMQTACAESMWPVLGGTKWLRYYHGLVATPIRPGDVSGGYVVWLALRSAVSAVVFLLVAAVLGGLESPWAVLAVPATMLTVAAFAAPLTAYAASRENDTTFSLIFRVVVQPLFLFSGTFFPVEQLPDRLEALVVLSPLWHGVELCRAATTGQGDLPAIAFHVGFLSALTAVGWWVGTRTFARKLAS